MPGKRMSCLGFTLFTAELGPMADWCLRAWVQGAGCRTGYTNPEPAKPPRTLHPTFGGKGEEG